MTGIPDGSGIRSLCWKVGSNNMYMYFSVYVKKNAHTHPICMKGHLEILRKIGRKCQNIFMNLMNEWNPEVEKEYGGGCLGTNWKTLYEGRYIIFNVTHSTTCALFTPQGAN